MSDSCLIMLAHGSKNPLWLKPFEQLLNDLRGSERNGEVYLAFMQMASPSLEDAIAAAIKDGKHRMNILPMLMSGGNHFHQDIPKEIEQLRKKNPGIRIELMQPIGSHPRFISMIKEIVSESCRDSESVSRLSSNV